MGGNDEFKENDKQADLVVWSEGVLRYSFPFSYNYYEAFPFKEPLIPFIKNIKTLWHYLNK